MFTISTAFYFFLTAGIAFAIGWFLQKRQGEDWKDQFEVVEKRNLELANDAKKHKKVVNRLEQEANTWESKFEKSEEKYIPLTTKLNTDMATLREQLAAKNNEYGKLMTERNRHAERVERLEKEIANLKEKYATDLADSKDWKRKREQLMRQVKEFQVKHARGQREIDVLNKKLAEQTAQIKEAKSFVSSLRKLKAENKKLAVDLEYWEKMHYKTHHELAATKETLEQLQANHTQLNELKKGGEAEQKELLTKIEEFKTKFVNMNDKYYKLLKKHGGIGQA